MTDPDADAARGERVAKWLARAGVASRRDAEKLVEEGVVRINGAVVTHPATFIQPDDIVQVRAAVIDAPDRTRLWRYHKPEGLMTTHKDPQGRPTVFDRLPDSLPRVVSIGRLDLNSEGLLLLTNDGARPGGSNCRAMVGSAATGCGSMAPWTTGSSGCWPRA